MLSFLRTPPSNFTWPHYCTRNEAHRLPATLPHGQAVFGVIQPARRTAEEPALGRGFPKHSLHPTEGQALCRPCTAVPSYHQSPSSTPQAAKEEAGQEIFTFSNRTDSTECQSQSGTPSLLGPSRDPISHRGSFFLPMQDTCTQPDSKTL